MLRTAGAMVLTITYGYPVKENDDPYVEVVDAAVRGVGEATTPGAFLFDVIPSCERCSLRSCSAGDVNYGYHFLTLARPTFQPIRYINHFIPALRSTSSPPLLSDSAIRPRLVPWNGVESQGQAIQKTV